MRRNGRLVTGIVTIVAVIIVVAAFAVGRITAPAATERVTKFRNATATDVTRPSSPLRPNYRDISLKSLTGVNNGNPYAFYRGHTATQVERDALEETLQGVAMPELYRYARTIGPCQSSGVNKVLTALSSVTSKLGPGYENKSMLGNKEWVIPTYGRHYSFERYALHAVHDCSVGSAAAACAASPLMTDALLDLLDLRREAGVCVAGASFAVDLHGEAFDQARGLVGRLQRRTSVPALSPHQLDLLAQTHAAHVAVSDYRCGVGPQPTVSVQAAHMALEATAVTEEQHHFMRMKDFAGVVDVADVNAVPAAVGWSSDQVCKIARMQDAAHERWMRAVEAGDWTAARVADNDHQLAHIMMGIHDPAGRLLLLFSGDVIPACAGKPVSNCPKLTESEVLAQAS